MTETPPRTIGRYEILGEIGRGMMGLVYRARDPDLDRVVALKTVRLAFAVRDDQHELFEKRFLAEARAAAAVSHPGIVMVHDVGRDTATGTLFIALEHLDGRNLDEMAGGGRLWDWREALRLAARVAQALHHAHAQGIVHRDVKPANIRVLPSGDPKVMDFGIAKLPAAQLTAAGELFGTPLYMSPEQAAGQSVDGRSDLFSLGVILYVLLTGRQPFEADTVPAILTRLAHHDPPPPSTFSPGLPLEVDRVVARAIAKDPGQRYASGKAMAEDVEDVLAGRPPRHSSADARPPTPPPPGHDAGPPAGGILRPLRSLSAAQVKWVPRALTGLIVAALLALLLVPGLGRKVPGRPAIVPSVEPAHLEVQLEHPLRSGALRVFVDEELLVDEPLESRVTRKVLFVKSRRGREEKLLEVAPGEHEVRVLVEGDGFRDSRRIRGEFTSGRTRRLSARVDGLIGKELSIAWE